jgi:hypothetical protein
MMLPEKGKAKKISGTYGQEMKEWCRKQHVVERSSLYCSCNVRRNIKIRKTWLTGHIALVWAATRGCIVQKAQCGNGEVKRGDVHGFIKLKWSLGMVVGSVDWMCL